MKKFNKFIPFVVIIFLFSFLVPSFNVLAEDTNDVVLEDENREIKELTAQELLQLSIAFNALYEKSEPIVPVTPIILTPVIEPPNIGTLGVKSKAAIKAEDWLLL